MQRVMRSGYLVKGAECRALEEQLSEYIGVKNAYTTSSGTAALHTALMVLGAGPGVRVHYPSYVCIALYNAVEYCKAEHSLCDVDMETGNLQIDEVDKRRKSDKDIVILPHMFGNPAKVRDFVDKGYIVIEDCAQAIGAAIDGKKVGSFGKAAIFSFYATKVICGAEGGAVVSDDENIIAKIADLCEYDNQPEFRLRYNYRMTDINAAITRVQLGELDSFICRRRQIAEMYDRALEGTKWRSLKQGVGGIYFRYVVICDDADSLIEKLREKGITAAKPVYMPTHRYLGLPGFSNSERLYRACVSIPSYPAMTEDEVVYVSEALKRV